MTSYSFFDYNVKKRKEKTVRLQLAEHCIFLLCVAAGVDLLFSLEFLSMLKGALM